LKIKRAIEILQHEPYLDPSLESPDIFQALALGIEALKEIKLLRQTRIFAGWERLPGETED